MEQGSQAWHDARDSCAITWSEAANAVGLGYDSPMAYMKRKLGQTPKKEANWKMTEGTAREPWAAELYYGIMRDVYEHPVKLWIDGFRRDPTDHRLGGSLDRMVTDAQDQRWLLEIKTTPGGDPRDHVPIAHLLQMHGLCHTYALPVSHYFCWTAGRSSFLSELSYDQRLWDEVLYPRYKEFANLWAIRALPERVSRGIKEPLEAQIRAFTTITQPFVQLQN